MKKCFKDELKSLKKELGTERSRKIKTKRKLEKLENQLEELKSVTKMSVSCQTNHSSDIPYSVSEELPPIFGSHLCQNTGCPTKPYPLCIWFLMNCKIIQ